MSSYRTHGVEGEHFNSYGAPSPYTPGSDHFFFSPTSPNPQQQPLRPYDDTEYSALPAPGDDHRASVGTQSTTPFISDPPGRFRSRYNRTFSNLSKTEEMLRKWSTGVHWYVPTSMVVIFLVGCMGALGHHLFNTSLDGEPAVNQLFMTRTGVFLAFCTKAALVGAVVLSYRFVTPFSPRLLGWMRGKGGAYREGLLIMWPQTTVMADAARKANIGQGTRCSILRGGGSDLVHPGAGNICQGQGSVGDGPRDMVDPDRIGHVPGFPHSTAPRSHLRRTV